YSYFNPFNQTNQQMLLKALQASADEIFEAYYSGVLPEKNQIEDMIPHITKLNDENNMDIAPMFYWDKENKQLLRRTNLTNPYDRHWTNSWWGWSTLLLLKTQYGITSTVQLSLSKYLSQYVPEELQDNPLV
ncbi:phospholipase, partial [Legionella pneumophila serogroup 1]